MTAANNRMQRTRVPLAADSVRSRYGEIEMDVFKWLRSKTYAPAAVASSLSDLGPSKVRRRAARGFSGVPFVRSR